MLYSMTGFASGKGAEQGFGWAWEIRSVNGKGLDLRLRVPEWIEGLEAGLRARLGQALGRGNVSLTLKLQADDQAGTLQLNEGQAEAVLRALAAVETRAMDMGLSLAPATAADVLALRGVLEQGQDESDGKALCKHLLTDFEAVLSSFQEMRAREGRELGALLEGHLDEIARLTDLADAATETRKDEMTRAFETALKRVTDASEGVDEARIAQELALLAVKADVTEEIGRLRAHVSAARDLLAQGSPIGRKLDFLSQEFNREANTLCSKAQNAGLTTIGLELKTVIDQMREQVQNVE